MTHSSAPTPSEINLHKKSRILSLHFTDGQQFDLPAEYLRVFSRAAEVRTQQQPDVGKENVNIDAIEAQGQYGIRIKFDDGHDTGIYSWESLYELGKNQQQNWQQYLQKLKDRGYARGSEIAGVQPAEKHIQLLYFAWMAQQFGKESEPLTLPEKVIDVDSFLDWLRHYHHRDKAYLLQEDMVRVTVNKQFVKPFTRIDEGDEIALVPTSPVAPAPPKQ
ncbi:MAG: DUF971 domain-containing protein [gamma proteobacterium symbiont of Bathyaustriella thionipta]|nr:DUF971 domain-containing protein [gamma proteobacterium symbiont of Bathyaustriella thionipta]